MGQLSKQVETQSNGGFNGNMLDDPRNYEVEREVKDKCKVVDGGVGLNLARGIQLCKYFLRDSIV